VHAGLDAIECYYTSHDANQRDSLLAFIRSKGLISSGGSDYHGFPMAGLTEVTNIPGSVDVPESVIDAMKRGRIVPKEAKPNAIPKKAPSVNPTLTL